MGWSSGSTLAEQIWDIVKDHIPLEDQPEVAAGICSEFENHDCDTLYEARLLHKTALIYPEYFVETYLKWVDFDYNKGYSYDLKSFREYLENLTEINLKHVSNRRLRRILKLWERR